jgi:uncharacterized membrane protein YraQ (UPF0718 family)
VKKRVKRLLFPLSVVLAAVALLAVGSVLAGPATEPASPSTPAQQKGGVASAKATTEKAGSGSATGEEDPTAAYEKGVKSGIVIFVSILWEALPFIVLGAILAGVLEELLPQTLVTRLVGGLDRTLPGGLGRLTVILLGGLLGLLFPMCECGIIPVMRRLLRKGLPLSCCVAYLLAGPIINVVVMLSTFVAFSPKGEQDPAVAVRAHQLAGLGMMGMRMLLGYAVAVGTGLIIEGQFRRHGYDLLAPMARPDKGQPVTDEDNGGGPQRSVWQKIANISETALHDFVDITVFLILGAVIAALVRVFLPHERMAELASQHWITSILIMMGLAILLCLCSEADAFVAASFAALRPSAKLAFLALGPMLDFKLFFMYTRVFRPRLIATIILSVVVQVFLYSVLFHLWWERSLYQ